LRRSGGSEGGAGAWGVGRRGVRGAEGLVTSIFIIHYSIFLAFNCPPYHLTALPPVPLS